MDVNLIKILKDVPDGTKMYSPIFGEVFLESVYDYISLEKSVYVKTARGGWERFDSEGHWMNFGFKSEEPMLFPSRDQRDWSKFELKK